MNGIYIATEITRHLGSLIKAGFHEDRYKGTNKDGKTLYEDR